MKNRIAILAFLLILIISQAACARSQTTPAPTEIANPTATPNAQATIDASVQATVQAQDAQQDAIDQAVQATLTAMPTPDYAEMSEEELSALIDTAVNEAMTDYYATTAAVSQSTSDGAVSSDEATTTTTYVYDVYYEIAYAEELIQAYYDYYGAYAEEALASLQAIEQDLSAISDSLNEIVVIMEQGAEAATAAIEQLNAAVAEAQIKAAETQTKVQNWKTQVQTQINDREKRFADIQPNQVETDKLGALIQTHDFLDAFKGALGDGKFSPDELANVAQLAANAKASLNGTGDPKMMDFATRIDGLTRNASRGEWGQARKGAGDFERSLPERPRRK